jgi:acetate kinase
MEGSGPEEHDAGTGAQYVRDHRGIASLADTILVVNAGSSSIKFSVYEIGDARTLGLASKGQMEGIGTQPRLRARDAREAALTDQKYSADDVPDVSAAMVCVGGWLRTYLA